VRRRVVGDRRDLRRGRRLHRTVTTVEEAVSVADAALAAQDAPWEVLAIRYGTRMTTRAACYAGYEQLGEPDAPLGMDYFCWLLRSERRTILVDTGFDAEVGTRRGRTTLCPPVDALARLGVTPEA